MRGRRRRRRTDTSTRGSTARRPVRRVPDARPRGRQATLGQDEDERGCSPGPGSSCWSSKSMPKPASPMTMPMAEVDQQGRQAGADRQADRGDRDEQHERADRAARGLRSVERELLDEHGHPDRAPSCVLVRLGAACDPLLWSPASTSGAVRCPSLAGCPALELLVVSSCPWSPSSSCAARRRRGRRGRARARSFPQTTASSSCPGSTGPVKVLRDDHGIPQIYADTADDLFRAQGYVHAQDRFFEMDFRRHITAGRLSEMFGEDGARDRQGDPHDGLAPGRRAGAARCSARDPRSTSRPTPTASTPTSTRTGRRARSPSSTPCSACSVPTTGPSTWTPVDSWPGSRRWPGTCAATCDDEIDRARLAGRPAPEQVDRALPRLPVRPAPADRRPGRGRRRGLRRGTRPAPATRNAARGRRRRRLRATALEPSPAGARRDARRCSGRRRRHRLQLLGRRRRPHHTGKPLLANDPHLGVGHARASGTRWACTAATVGADCPFDVTGFTFSGVPGVVIGHNAEIAWGFTNLGPDVTDLYLEQVERRRRTCTTASSVPLSRAPGDHQGRRRRRPSQITVRATAARPAALRRVAELRRRGRQRAGRRATPDAATAYAVALALDRAATRAAPRTRSSRSTRRPDWDAVPGRGRATSRCRRRTSSTPTRDGHIGYQAPGRIPIRQSGNGAGRLLAGAGLGLAEYDWTGLRPVRRSCPASLDPDGGLHRRPPTRPSPAADYPYFLTDRLGLRLPQPADPRPARADAAGSTLGRRMAADPARHPQRLRADAGAVPARRDRGRRATPRRAATCCATGTSPSRRTVRRPRPPTTTRCGATCSS